MRNRLVEKYNLTMDIRYKTQDSYTVYRMVEAGLGIGLNNSLTNERWEGEVVVLPLSPSESITIGLALFGEYRPPAVERFVEFVREWWDG